MAVEYDSETVLLEDINQKGHRFFPFFDAPDQVVYFDLDELAGQVHASSMDAERCLNCGKSGARAFLLVDGKAVSKEPCLFPDGGTYELELEVPSGRLLVAKNLDELFTDLPRSAHYGDSMLKQIQSAGETANHGLIRGVGGRTSPNLYRDNATGNLLLASPGYVEKPPFNAYFLTVPDTWELLSDINEDLSTYAAMDYDNFQWRVYEKNITVTEDSFGGHMIVDVQPGTWFFQHLATKADFRDTTTAEPNIFAQFSPTGTGLLSSMRP